MCGFHCLRPHGSIQWCITIAIAYINLAPCLQQKIDAFPMLASRLLDSGVEGCRTAARGIERCFCLQKQLHHARLLLARGDHE